LRVIIEKISAWEIIFQKKCIFGESEIKINGAAMQKITIF